MSTNHKFIAVPDYNSDELTGATVWWHLQSEVGIESLRNAWLAEGLDEKLLPKLPTPGHALHHTAHKLADKRRREHRRLSRPLEGKNGWALVDEDAKGEELDYGNTCRLKLDAADNITIEPGDHPLRAQAEMLFQHYSGVYTHVQIGAWLTDLAHRHRAVSLRETGGVYFIPRDQMASFKRHIKVLHSVSQCRVHELPTLRSEEAIDAVVSAVTREAEHEMAEMEKAVDSATLGERALQGRANRCQRMLAYVESYERTLDTGLDKLKERIESLKASIVQAAMIASVEADDQRGVA